MALFEVYLPGPSHLTTLLHIFPSLFDRVKKALKVEEMGEGGIPLLLEVLRIVIVRKIIVFV